MVNLLDPALDRTFAALADPTRRTLLTQLTERPGQSVSELAQPYSMSLPALMKHLEVLSEAGLISRTKTGRTVSCEITPEPLEEAIAWIERHQKFWTETLDNLAAFVEEEPSL